MATYLMQIIRQDDEIGDRVVFSQHMCTDENLTITRTIGPDHGEEIEHAIGRIFGYYSLLEELL